MKICRSCGNTLPLTEFYTHPRMADGHLNKCKTCVKQRVLKHRRLNIEKVRAYDRARAQLPHRVKKTAHVSERYRKAFPERVKANLKLSRAVKTGLVKKLPCWVCGCEKTVGHHPAYSMPLDVVWLCQAHHKQLHAEVV